MSVRAVREATLDDSSLSPDEFHALEEKISRTIDMLKSAREGRAAERDAGKLRGQLQERGAELNALQSEMVKLRRERDEVRTRVEKMLAQIDQLTEEESRLQ